jgi:hypothetical protein
VGDLVTRGDLIVVLRRHPREAVALSTAVQVMEAPKRMLKALSSGALSFAWAIDATMRAARGETDRIEVQAAFDAATLGVSMLTRHDDDPEPLRWHFELQSDPYLILQAAGCAARVMLGQKLHGAETAIHLCAMAEGGSAPAWRSQLAARLPLHGSAWGPWHAGRVIARSGGYLWRESEGRFVGLGEITSTEAVDLDGLIERFG